MKIITLLFIFLSLPIFTLSGQDGKYAVTVKVENLRNSKGVVQFSLYNEDGTLPDEKYERYMKKQIGKIVNGSSSITFTDIPKGIYAVNILHDENSNGKIDKGILLPVEGIGFSNYDSIGLTNRPDFSGASFTVDSNMKIDIKIIYM